MLCTLRLHPFTPHRSSSCCDNCSSKFLGYIFSIQKLCLASIIKKAFQWQYFHRRLKQASICSPELMTFYQCSVECTIISIITWDRNDFASGRKVLQRLHYYPKINLLPHPVYVRPLPLPPLTLAFEPSSSLIEFLFYCCTASMVTGIYCINR